jgi:protein-arginine kinase activator protein McsA
MQCEKCHERFATVHLRGGPDGQEPVEHHYCEVCFPIDSMNDPEEAERLLGLFGLLPPDEPDDSNEDVQA